MDRRGSFPCLCTTAILSSPKNDLSDFPLICTSRPPKEGKREGLIKWGNSIRDCYFDKFGRQGGEHVLHLVGEVAIQKREKSRKPDPFGNLTRSTFIVPFFRSSSLD